MHNTESWEEGQSLKVYYKLLFVKIFIYSSEFQPMDLEASCGIAELSDQASR